MKILPDKIKNILPEITKKSVKKLVVEPFDSIDEMLKRSVKEVPSEIAFRFINRHNVPDSATYAKFLRDTDSIGIALADMGFSEKHIACTGENSYYWVTVFLSTLRGRNVFVPIDKELTLDNLVYIISNSDTEIVFCDKKREDLFFENADKFPSVKYFICFSRDEDDGRFLSYEKFIRKGYSLLAGGNGYILSERSTDVLKMLVYTSGTTGVAKGVMLSEKNLVNCVRYCLMASTCSGTQLSVLPYSHTYEAVCGILVALHQKVTICINESLRSVLKNFKLYKPTYTLIVPAFAELFYRRIWENAENSGKKKTLEKALLLSNALRKVGVDKRRSYFHDIHETFGGNLNMIVCGGAPLRPEVTRFFDAIGIQMTNGYGITECSPLVATNRVDDNDLGSVGKPLGCLRVKIDDVSEDGIGEICVKGDSVMLGYYKNEEATKAVMRDGWFCTGDYGYINENKSLCVTGRKKNVIVLQNGKNVYPEEIEYLLESENLVREVLVYGETDSSGNVTICAAIFPDFTLLNKNLSEKNITPDDERYDAEVKQAVIDIVKRINDNSPTFRAVKKAVVRRVEFDKTSTNKIKRFSEANKTRPDDIK